MVKPDELTRALANAEKNFQDVEAQFYEIGLSLLLGGFARRDIEAEMLRYYEKIAAQTDVAGETRSVVQGISKQVIRRALDRAESEFQRSRLQ